MPVKSQRCLKDVVGGKVYEVWVEMLKQLVPDGRTHRLSVILASMLQYAYSIAQRLEEDALATRSVASSLIRAGDLSPDEIKAELHDVVSLLFEDEGVTFERVSKRGETYSIADEAYNEFMRWFDYPWE